MKIRLRFALACLVIAGTGCPTFHPKPERDERPIESYSERDLRMMAKADTLDPWPHFGLGVHAERKKNHDRAIFEYGECINRLPPRRYTRPMIALGILHHRLGSLRAARRCYLEVLETFPSKSTTFKKNPDYKSAALGLKPMHVAARETEALARLKKRFIDEFGGSEAEWKRGPVWIKPIKRKKQ